MIDDELTWHYRLNGRPPKVQARCSRAANMHLLSLGKPVKVRLYH